MGRCKTLKVIAGKSRYDKTDYIQPPGPAGNELERGAETQYVLAYLRRAVCRIASSRMNIESFRNEAVLRDVVDAVYSFMLQLATQSGTLSRLTGRREVNFLDVLNGLYLTDHRVYSKLLFTRRDWTCSSENSSSLELYTAARLGRKQASAAPMHISLPPSFLDFTVQRLVDTYHAQQADLQSMELPGDARPEESPPPKLEYEELMAGSGIIMPAKPELVSNLIQLLKSIPGQKGPPASIERRAVTKHCAQMAEQRLIPSKAYPPAAGVIVRPAAVAAEQTSLVKAVLAHQQEAQEMADSTTKGDGSLPGLPLPVPTSIPIWMPVFPSTSIHASHPITAADQLRSVFPESHQPQPEAPPSNDDRASLQMELSVIEPSYPLVLEVSRHNGE